MIQEEIPRIQDYLYDLNNTCFFNLEGLEQMISCDTQIFNKKQTNDNKKHQEIVKLMSNIKNLYKSKSEKYKLKLNIKGKLLLDAQIEIEINKNLYESEKAVIDEQNELEEANLKKQNILAQNEKKFIEVEIFIQRECLLDDKKYHKYKNFIIATFLRQNQDYSYSKHVSEQFLLNIRSKIKECENEIKKIKISKNKVPLGLNSSTQKSERVILLMSDKISSVSPLIDQKYQLHNLLKEKEKLLIENNSLIIKICKKFSINKLNNKEFDKQKEFSISDNQQIQLYENILTKNDEDIFDKINLNEKKILQINENISLLSTKKEFVNLEFNLTLSCKDNLFQQSIDKQIINKDLNITIGLDESMITKNIALDTEQDKWDISVINTNFDY